jgi:hypothetical protein
MAQSKWNDIKDKLILIEGWARDGLTDEQIYNNLGISKDTFYRYKREHQDFSDILKKGKEVVDRQVENALLKRALGYTYVETKTEESEKDGIKTTTTVKEVVPDTTAQIFWLKNRKRNEWRDKQEIEHSGETTSNVNIDMSKLSLEELKKLANLK